MLDNYKEIQQTLEKKLASAFRYGTSAFRLGLIQQGPSDHLPITATINTPETTLSLISWNLLAEDHLYNNFINVSGTALLRDLILKEIPGGNAYCEEKQNKLFYFFAELAAYLYDRKSQSQLLIDAVLLRDFIDLNNQPSKLALSRDPGAASKKAIEVTKAREAIITIFINEIFNNPCEDIGHELKLALRHSLELIHHIKSDEGALRWQNRLKLITKNKPLIDTLRKADVICLQECSNPKDIVDLLGQTNPMRPLIHRINNTTNDHCVLLYNEQKYALLGSAFLGAIEGKKPYILAKVKDKNSGKIFVLGSVHHPGGAHNHLEEVQQNLDRLLNQEPRACEYFILGDFNHTREFFSNDFKGELIYPTEGTMSGSDYDNVNQPIDALLTSLDTAQAKVERIDGLHISTPAARIPLIIQFDSKDTFAYPGFFQRVASENFTLSNSFDAAPAKHASRSSL